MDGHQKIFSTFVQDRLRLLSNLTLDLGLRYELAPPLYDTRGQTMGLDFSHVPTPQAIFANNLPTNYYEPTFYICGQAGYPKGCAYTDKTASHLASALPGKSIPKPYSVRVRASFTASPISARSPV
jgi:hypothetical protein